MGRRIVLQSTLAPTAIALKLRAVVGDRRTAAKAGVTGQGSDTDMMLCVYRPNFQNSFATRLDATMAASGGGTRIAGSIGPPRSANLFMIVWFGFLSVFIIGAGAALSAAGNGAMREMWPMIAIPLGMMAFGVLLYKLGTWTAKKDEAAILSFLEKEISAREIDGG